jgi:hypothetical protein
MKPKPQGLIQRAQAWWNPKLFCPECGELGYKQAYLTGPLRFCIGHGWWNSVRDRWVGW